MTVTTAWQTSEPGRRRNSFNAIVARKQFDPPEDDIKFISMGRQAELGPDWVPNPILARVRAGTLQPTRAASYTQLPGRNESPQLPDMTSGSFRTLAIRNAVHREQMLSGGSMHGSMSMTGFSNMSGESQQSRLQLSPSAMLRSGGTPDSQSGRIQRGRQITPLKSPGARSASTTIPGSPPSSAGSQFASAVNGPGMSSGRRQSISELETTTHWSSNEATVVRDNFNKIVTRQSFDPPHSRMMQKVMGRKAEYDGNFEPSAIYARRKSGSLPPRYAGR